jgi:hypothetical protein
VYNDETVEKQSTNMFTNEKMWLSEFLYASIEVLWSRLRVGGYIVFQSVRYDYIGEHMMREHADKKKDGVFKGIISRVTTSGRYKPNWVWQKINPLSEGRVEEEETKKPDEKEPGEKEPGEKVPKKKMIFVKRKTLKKSTSPPSDK